MAGSPRRGGKALTLSPGPAPFGLMLAGGLSRRMGGQDKTLLPLPGGFPLSILRDRLQPQCTGLAISANGSPDRFAALGLVVIADGHETYAGPLAGVLAGLDYLAAQGRSDWLLTVPGDTPFIPSDLAARLTATAKDCHVRIARATSAGRSHPVVALWSPTIRSLLREALVTRDLRRAMAFQAEIGVGETEWAVSPYDPFFNLNSPADLAEARLIAAAIGV